MASDLSGYPKEFATLLAEYNKEVTRLMGELEAGELNAKAWEAEMKQLLGRYAVAANLLGAEESSLGQRGAGVFRWLSDQTPYLDGFASVIASAGEYNPAWLPRAEMYGASTYTQYWEGKTDGLALPAQPAQGTQCLSNCHCSWEIKWIDKEKGDADCYWRLGQAEHCQTCETRAEKWSPVRIRGGDLQAPSERFPEPTPPPPKPPRAPRAPKPEPPPGPPGIRTGPEIRKDLEAIRARVRSGDFSRAQGIVAAQDLLKAANPSKVRMFKSTAEGVFDKKDAASLRTAGELFNRTIDSTRLGKLTRITALHYSGDRSFCDGGAASIHLSTNVSLRTILHESGHAWEHKNKKEVYKAARAFLKYRTKGESPIQLQTINAAYRPEEVAWFDKFISPYMGKKYESSTEIVSMGLEHYLFDPFDFASRDPEYFDFIHNLTKGLPMKEYK